MQYSLLEVLQPAIDMAEQGFPVAPMAAHMWGRGSGNLTQPGNTHGKDMLLNGQAPKAGDIMKMPFLAKTFKVTHSTKWLDQYINEFFTCVMNTCVMILLAFFVSS